jgi:hypothetical protein
VITYETDTLRCCYVSKETKKRCTMRGTYDNGAGVLCSRHQQIRQRERANNQPIVRKAK